MKSISWRLLEIGFFDDHFLPILLHWFGCNVELEVEETVELGNPRRLSRGGLLLQGSRGGDWIWRAKCKLERGWAGLGNPNYPFVICKKRSKGTGIKVRVIVSDNLKNNN